jgi:GAF domain-containing protein
VVQPVGQALSPLDDSDPDIRDDTGDVHRALIGLSQIALSADSLDATLRQIADLAKDTIRGVEATSVTMMENDKARTVVFTSPLAVQLDERQYELGFGPCMDAAITGQTITLDAQAPGSSPYPDFAEVALRAGARHVVSIGMPMNQRVVGGLNIYGSAELPFTGRAVELAQTFAGYAAVAVFNAASYHDAVDLAAQLQEAMRSRAIIEQAKGMIMLERRCDADTAFKVLIRASQSQNLKLRRVAELLIERRTAPAV